MREAWVVKFVGGKKSWPSNLSAFRVEFFPTFPLLVRI